MASRLYNILNGIITPFGKTLWTGSWSSGKKTIPGASKYMLFIVLMNNTPMITMYDPTEERVTGFSMTGNAGFAGQYDQRFRASVDGDDWTITWLEQVNHTNSSPYHSLSSSAKTISRVIGLVPKWG